MREAEHQARAAAEAAGVPYYNHPRLHMHSYSHRGSQPNGLDVDGAPVAAVPDVAAPPPSQAVGAAGIVNGAGAGVNGAGVNGVHRATPPPQLQPTAAYNAESIANSSAPPTPVFTAPGSQRRPSGASDSSPEPQVKDDPLKGAEWAMSQTFQPPLQVLCGPLLSYYTTIADVWYGAVMVVTRDSNSSYESPPALALSFAPYGQGGQIDPAVLQPHALEAQRFFQFNDTHSTEEKDDNRPELPGPYEHNAGIGQCSFWRFKIIIPLQNAEVAVQYRLNNSTPLQFVLPAIGQNFRWTSHSCNGLSLGVKEKEFRTSKFKSGFDPLWMDMLEKHAEKPYHCMVGGGDQIYSDLISFEPSLQGWLHEPNKKTKRTMPVTDNIEKAIDHFYFQHYCKMFGRNSNGFAQANSTIPMVNMLDDHDLIDGFGTYDDATMKGPIFSLIGNRGYFWYLAFQLFTVDAFDGVDYSLGNHWIPSLFFGGMGPYIKSHAHSLMVYLGPNVALMALDCRAERTYHQIVSKESYEGAFYAISQLPPTVQQLVLLLGVPIAYPRMSFLEHFLGFKYNPAIMLARHNALGLGSLVNKFDKEPELLDDLNDHWCANVHKKERNALVIQLQDIALRQRLRITFLSGDVHLCAVGRLFTHKHKEGGPETDHRYMLNVITSAIVNTPPPGPVAWLVAKLGGHKHRTLHRKHTDEDMVDVFQKDTDGSHVKRPYVLARRNYASIEYKSSGALEFDIRVEKEKGAGTTIGYPVNSPPPQWKAAPAGSLV